MPEGSSVLGKHFCVCVCFNVYFPHFKIFQSLQSYLALTRFFKSHFQLTFSNLYIFFSVMIGGRWSRKSHFIWQCVGREILANCQFVPEPSRGWGSLGGWSSCTLASHGVRLGRSGKDLELCNHWIKQIGALALSVFWFSLKAFWVSFWKLDVLILIFYYIIKKY